MITQINIKDFTPSANKTIYDVRDEANYKAGHIEYAQNQPIETLDQALLDSTTGDVYVLCGGGTKAERACTLLNEIDPTRNIIHITGGTRGAQALGMPIIRESDKS
ncbi:sulfurtransferase [Moraxella bovoculi]|uniref:Sulfurtransferase n=1 Tax=Moraxella bovoculi TaxID=386891 RepID=A0AAC8PW65_9GAMM|nr:rhodanese-like domain-containing protein [Moraxella bovoculi]AKG08123.1 sulfurtransferase [Moraxella bovoculi]AKG09321.1 sulfurtransferase [Moraxella bovoculi]AKG11155.1 sulfurtransferase [Moraxella bovoculi]AKG13147.1 sulfurtransferase [Moraxella bovoculi]